ncbi:MAG TPA: hypothetical protein IAA28_02475 [Candidatus Lachnoclostridium stercoripullorum]|uniref:Uncharacterized protein n=1 Tax=Candidatus Lachnoclostridium stercoripullorum TaxID=2838635 RepID=A0A9D2AWG6_9FIRM|nr:hypothetical protein [Candidatus Lachnoclostridium stercoripullorum]
MTDWKKDPRLKAMDPRKLEILEDFSRRLRRTPGPNTLSALLSLQAEAAAQGIQFTDQETSLLVSILAADMAPADQKKLSVLRMFSRKFF